METTRRRSFTMLTALAVASWASLAAAAGAVPPAGVPPCPSGEDKPDVAQLVRRTEQLLQGRTSVGVMAMTIKTPSWTRKLKMKVGRGVAARRALAPSAGARRPRGGAANTGERARLRRVIDRGKYVRDAVLGADFSGDVGPLGVHGEGAWTLPLEGLDDGLANVSVGRHFLRAVVGVDWRPAEKWVLFAEYHFNGWGTRDAARYVETLRSDRVTRGEVFGAGRHYAGLVVAWQASDLLSVQATALANLQDPSALVVPALEYWLEQSVLLRAGGYVPIGRPPDPAALRS